MAAALTALCGAVLRCDPLATASHSAFARLALIRRAMCDAQSQLQSHLEELEAA